MDTNTNFLGADMAKKLRFFSVREICILHYVIPSVYTVKQIMGNLSHKY